jgi:hypothetical protein
MKIDGQFDQKLHTRRMRAPWPWLFAVLFVSLCGSLFWGVEQRRELARARLDAAASQQTPDELEGRLRTAEQARIAAETSLQGQHEMNLRRVFPEGRSAADPSTIDKFNAALDSDPVWGPFYQKLERRRIIARYGILVTALKVPPGEQAELEDLLVERAIAARRIIRQIRNAGGKQGSPEAIAAVSKTTDAIDARIEKLVGADAAQSLKEWNSAVYLFGNAPDGAVAQDAVTLKDAGFELSTEQLVRLALIRHEVLVLNPEAASGLLGAKIDPKTGLTGPEDKLLKREAEVLSADEIAVLRNWATEEHRARAVLQAIRAEYHIEPDRGSR